MQDVLQMHWRKGKSLCRRRNGSSSLLCSGSLMTVTDVELLPGDATGCAVVWQPGRSQLTMTSLTCGAGRWSATIQHSCQQPLYTMEITAEVLAKCKLKYYRI